MTIQIKKTDKWETMTHRILKSLRNKMKRAAKRENMSVRQFISEAIEEKVGK